LKYDHPLASERGRETKMSDIVFFILDLSLLFLLSVVLHPWLIVIVTPVFIPSHHHLGLTSQYGEDETRGSQAHKLQDFERAT
jgi:hypothetical protein